jgi:chemotaxis regulatin CheY-phosphate phosphatase CheZ
MNQLEVESILQKAAEVKVFCEYGQRTIPVLDEIAAFLGEISPAIEDLKAVLDVAMVNIPKAAGQLVRVTEATEQATTQILNTLDKMVTTLDEVISAVSAGMAASDLGAATTKMAGVVKKIVDKSGWDADIVELAEAWDAHLKNIKKSGPGNLEQLLKNLQDDCTEIMMALQVQDITQQHIGTVMGTIETVADELQKLTTGFFSGSAAQQPSINLTLPPNPELVGEQERKKMVDSLLNKARAGQL